MANYEYDPWVIEELNRVLRGMFSTPGISLKRTSLREDLAGADLRYVVNNNCPLAIRLRFDRPAGAADTDITFRTTEPSMIIRGTYAPLGITCWFVKHHIVAAKLVDIYRMADRIRPSLEDRECTVNFDETTAFVCVGIDELHKAGALLRIYDGNVWATAVLGGEKRMNDILKAANEAA